MQLLLTLNRRLSIAFTLLCSRSADTTRPVQLKYSGVKIHLANPPFVDTPMLRESQASQVDDMLIQTVVCL